MQNNKPLVNEEVGIMSHAYLGVYMALALVATVIYHSVVSNLFA